MEAAVVAATTQSTVDSNPTLSLSLSTAAAGSGQRQWLRVRVAVAGKLTYILIHFSSGVVVGGNYRKPLSFFICIGVDGYNEAPVKNDSQLRCIPVHNNIIHIIGIDWHALTS